MNYERRIGRIEHADGERTSYKEAMVIESVERNYAHALVAAHRSASDDELIEANSTQQRAVQLAIDGQVGMAIRYHNHALAMLGQRRG